MPDKAMISREYIAWLDEIKSRIRSARVLAARSVNRELILLYWDIGRGILHKQEQLGWGKSTVEQLAKDLKEYFPGVAGFSARNLWDMRRLVESYTNEDFLAQVVQQLDDFEIGSDLRQAVAEFRVALGNKEYFIDLLFYHRFLKCLVAIELKVGEFEPDGLSVKSGAKGDS